MVNNISNNKKLFIYLVLALVVVIVLITTVLIVVIKTNKSSSPAVTINSSSGEAQAVEKVRALSEVQEFLKIVPKGIVEMDSENKETNSYVIHVYEIKDGHTATLNWYNVNKETGKVTTEFEF